MKPIKFRNATLKGEKLYRTSKKYELLYEFAIKNNKMKIPCFADFNPNVDPLITPARDIVHTVSLDGKVCVMCRGISYIDFTKSLSEFIEKCERLNLSWIKPVD